MLCDGVFVNLILFKILCGFLRVVLFVNDDVEDLSRKYFVDMFFNNLEDLYGSLIFVMICLSY